MIELVTLADYFLVGDLKAVLDQIASEHLGVCHRLEAEIDARVCHPRRRLENAGDKLAAHSKYQHVLGREWLNATKSVGMYGGYLVAKTVFFYIFTSPFNRPFVYIRCNCAADFARETKSDGQIGVIRADVGNELAFADKLRRRAQTWGESDLGHFFSFLNS